MIDAAELARLWEQLKQRTGPPYAELHTACGALLDALGKARRDIEEATETFKDEQAAHVDTIRLFQRAAAERDSARALLRKSGEIISAYSCRCDVCRDILARIAVELEDAPPQRIDGEGR